MRFQSGRNNQIGFDAGRDAPRSPELGSVNGEGLSRQRRDLRLMGGQLQKKIPLLTISRDGKKNFNWLWLAFL